MGRRELLAGALYRLGIVHLVGWWRRRRAEAGPIFLTGHRVLPAAAAADPVDRMALLSGHAIEPGEMERRLRFLLRWVMPAGDPAELVAGIPRRRAFYLTFDDGYRDNVEHAAPVLQRLGVRALMFAVPQLVQRPDASPWWDRWGGEALAGQPNEAAAESAYGRRCQQRKAICTGLDEDDLAPASPRRYLNAQELAALPPEFSVGNHTLSHANLTLLGEPERRRHIDEAEAVLSAHPRWLPVLAFPFGTHDSALVESLRRSGRYAVAFATGGGRALDPLRARRINLNVRSFPLFAAQSVGLLN